MSKTKEAVVKLLFIMFIIVGMFTIGGEEVKADTSAKTEQEVVIKTSNLKGGKIIRAPKKESALNNNVNFNSTSNSTAINRGGYVDNGSLGGKAVAIASQYIGLPYVYGAEGPNSFDCSGLTKYVYGKLGYSLPHYTGSQWNMGVRIYDRNSLLPGDLVFFNTSGPVSHVGIYIGEGKFIHAPRPGKSVSIASMNESYYSSRYAGSVRIGS